MAKKNFKTGTSIEIVGLESLLSCLKQETRRFLRCIVLFKVGIKISYYTPKEPCVSPS